MAPVAPEIGDGSFSLLDQFWRPQCRSVSVAAAIHSMVSPLRCRSAHFVGRVGGLAVALGIGIALAHSPAAAWADTSGSSGSLSSAGLSGDGNAVANGPVAPPIASGGNRSGVRTNASSHSMRAARNQPSASQLDKSNYLNPAKGARAVVVDVAEAALAMKSSNDLGPSIKAWMEGEAANSVRMGTRRGPIIGATQRLSPASFALPSHATANSGALARPALTIGQQAPRLDGGLSAANIDVPPRISAIINDVTDTTAGSTPAYSATPFSAARPPGFAAMAMPASLPQRISAVLASVTIDALMPAGPLSPTTDPPVNWALAAAWSRRQSVQTMSAGGFATPYTAPVAEKQALNTNASASSTDSTAALQAMFDNLKPGDTLYIPPGTYQHSGNLYIRTSNVTVYGDNATFQATNPNTSALYIQADNVTVQDLALIGPTGSARQNVPPAAGLVFGGSGVTVKNVVITNTAGVGIYAPGAQNFTIQNVFIDNTGADGIQISAGASHGTVTNVRVQNTGDDGIAIVSYSTDPKPVSDIQINSPFVLNSMQTRGIAIVGGQNITLNNIYVQSTALSGLFIGSQVFTDDQGNTFSTQSVSGVTVNGGRITYANWATGIPLGAITVYNDNPNATVSNVNISGVLIVEPLTPYFNIGNAVMNGGGSLSGINYRNIAIYEKNVRPVFYAVPAGSYTASGFTMNNKPITV